MNKQHGRTPSLVHRVAEKAPCAFLRERIPGSSIVLRRHSRLVVMALVIAAIASCTKQIPVQRATAASVPNCAVPDKTGLRIDLPWQAKANKAYQLHTEYHIASDEKDPNRRKDQVVVTSDDNGHVIYNPATITLKPNAPTDIKSVVMLDTPSGLTQVRINAAGLPPDATSATLNIDLGFRGRVHWQDKTAIESWSATAVPLQIVDTAGAPLPLDAPIIVDLTASNAKIHLRDRSADCPDNPKNVPRPAADDDWLDYATTDVAIQQSDIGTIELRPNLFGSGHGVLRVRGYINDRTQLIFDAIEPFDITPPWWTRVGIAILGATVYASYQATRTLSSRRLPLRLLSGVSGGFFAGILAWALAD